MVLSGEAELQRAVGVAEGVVGPQRVAEHESWVADGAGQAEALDVDVDPCDATSMEEDAFGQGGREGSLVGEPGAGHATDDVGAGRGAVDADQHVDAVLRRASGH